MQSQWAKDSERMVCWPTLNCHVYSVFFFHPSLILNHDQTYFFFLNTTFLSTIPPHAIDWPLTLQLAAPFLFPAGCDKVAQLASQHRTALIHSRTASKGQTLQSESLSGLARGTSSCNIIMQLYYLLSSRLKKGIKHKQSPATKQLKVIFNNL